jgi:large subunit ribosomal protein L3
MEENKNNETNTQTTIEPVTPEFKYIIGRKLGMTQIFDPSGEVKAVTLIEAGPCKVVYTRTKEKDGYNAVCLGFENTNKVNKPLEGIFKKYGVEPFKHLKEFRFDKVDNIKPGQIVTVENRFNEGEWVDVHGRSIGKGFAGVMKRHNFSGQPASHGASDRERAPGSLASRRPLGRVIPGHRMAGHLGDENVCVCKIQIVKVIPEKNIIMVNGSVPGKEGSIVFLKKTTKTIKLPKQTTQVKSQVKKEAAKQAKKK